MDSDTSYKQEKIRKKRRARNYRQEHQIALSSNLFFNIEFLITQFTNINSFNLLNSKQTENCVFCFDLILFDVQRENILNLKLILKKRIKQHFDVQFGIFLFYNFNIQKLERIISSIILKFLFSLFSLFNTVF